MTHYQFGEVVGTPETGGIVDRHSAVLFREYQTLAVETLQEGKELPVITLALSGRVNKTQDTVDATFLMSVMDAGMIAGALLDAARRIGGNAESDFVVGMHEAQTVPDE